MERQRASTIGGERPAIPPAATRTRRRSVDDSARQALSQLSSGTTRLPPRRKSRTLSQGDLMAQLEASWSLLEEREKDVKMAAGLSRPASSTRLSEIGCQLLDEKNKAEEEFQAELASMRERLSMFEIENDRALQQSLMVQEENTGLRAEQTELEDEIQQLRMRLGDREGLHEAAGAEADQLARELAGVRDDLSKARNEASRYRSQCEDLKGRLEATQLELTQSQSHQQSPFVSPHRTDSFERRPRTKSDAPDLREEVKKYAEDNVALRGEVTRLQGLSATNRRLTADVDRLNQEIAELMESASQVTELNATIEELTQTNEHLMSRTLDSGLVNRGRRLSMSGEEGVVGESIFEEVMGADDGVLDLSRGEDIESLDAELARLEGGTDNEWVLRAEEAEAAADEALAALDRERAVASERRRLLEDAQRELSVMKVETDRLRSAQQTLERLKDDLSIVRQSIFRIGSAMGVDGDADLIVAKWNESVRSFQSALVAAKEEGENEMKAEAERRWTVAQAKADAAFAKERQILLDKMEMIENDLSKRLSFVKSEKDSALERASQAEAEEEATQKRMIAAETELRLAIERAEQAESEEDSMAQRLLVVDEAIKDALEKVEKSEKEKKEVMKLVVSLKSEIADRDGQVAQLRESSEAAHESHTSEIASLRSEISDRDGQLEQLRESSEAAHESHTSEIASLRSEIADRDGQVAQLRESSEAAHESHTSEIASLRSEIADRDAKLAQLRESSEAAHEAHASEIASLRSEIADRDTKLSHLLENTQQLTSQFSALEATNSDLNKKLLQAEDALSTTFDRATFAESQLSELQSAIKAALAERDEAEAECERMTKERDDALANQLIPLSATAMDQVDDSVKSMNQITPVAKIGKVALAQSSAGDQAIDAARARATILATALSEAEAECDRLTQVESQLRAELDSVTAVATGASDAQEAIAALAQARHSHAVEIDQLKKEITRLRTLNKDEVVEVKEEIKVKKTDVQKDLKRAIKDKMDEGVVKEIQTANEEDLKEAMVDLKQAKDAAESELSRLRLALDGSSSLALLEKQRAEEVNDLKLRLESEEAIRRALELRVSSDKDETFLWKDVQTLLSLYARLQSAELRRISRERTQGTDDVFTLSDKRIASVVDDLEQLVPLNSTAAVSASCAARGESNPGTPAKPIKSSNTPSSLMARSWADGLDTTNREEDKSRRALIEPMALLVLDNAALRRGQNDLQRTIIQQGVEKQREFDEEYNAWLAAEDEEERARKQAQARCKIQ